MVTPKIWDGAAWVDKTTKADYTYWDGATWTEPTDVRVWNGSSWETIFTTPPAGTIALRDSATTTQNRVSAFGTPDSIDVTIPASTQIGDFLVLTVAQTSNATTLFNAISGWTKQGEQRAGAAAHTMAVFTRVAQSGDAGSTVTATMVNTENTTAHLRVYSGVNQTTPLDATTVFGQVDPAATSGAAPAITVTTTDAMLVAVYTVPTTTGTTLNAAAWTDPSGFSNELVTCTTNTTNNAALATYNMITPGTGSQGPFTATITQSRRWAVATLALRPA